MNQPRLFVVESLAGPGTRICRDCKEAKPITSFKIHSQSPNFAYPSCNECDRRHGEVLKGVDYWDVAAKQGGEHCAICGKPPGERRLHIDVRRATWSVEGLLCFNCNSGLGKFHHRATLLASAIVYIGDPQ